MWGVVMGDNKLRIFSEETLAKNPIFRAFDINGNVLVSYTRALPTVISKVITKLGTNLVYRRLVIFVAYDFHTHFSTQQWEEIDRQVMFLELSVTPATAENTRVQTMVMCEACQSGYPASFMVEYNKKFYCRICYDLEPKNEKPVRTK